MNSPYKQTFIKDHMLLLVIALMVLYWFLESAMHVLVFGEASIRKALFPTDLDELWMRGLICGLFFCFGLYAKMLLSSLKQTQDFLDESERKCRELSDALRRANEKLRQRP